MSKALELSDIGVRFGGIAALFDVSLHVNSGEICGLMGANGAGKTTLFDVISGVRPPYAGQVWLHGTDVTNWGPHRRARAGLRRTFQRVQTFGWLTVEENLLVATEWEGGGGGVLGDLIAWPARKHLERSRRERAHMVLEQCGLNDIAHMSAGSLPIGRARLVELARAMMGQPTVLLLDEPASGLDQEETRRFGELIQQIATESQTAVLLVEHDVGFIMDHSDRIVVLHLGQVLTEGLPHEIRDDPRVRDAYLGVSTA